MSRSSLSEQHRTQALLELGEDYMRAGLLDRAEKLFSELTEDGRYSEMAVRSLLSIYQQEKDWSAAIVQARRLERVAGVRTGLLIAQFHCELALQSAGAGDRDSAREHLRAARAHHPDCTRALLIEAEFESGAGRWENAAAAYRRACDLDPDIVVLVIDDLVECHARMERNRELLDWLQQLVERGDTLAPVLAYATTLASEEPTRAIDFLLDQMQQRPTVRGLHHLLELMHRHGHGIDEIDPEVLRDLMRRLLAEQPRFRCRQCGFSGQTWHWQCPSCREWETTRPVVGVLGE